MDAYPQEPTVQSVGGGGRKWLGLAAVLVLVMVVAGAGAYFLVLKKDSPERLQLETPSGPANTPQAKDIDFNGRWAVTSGSVAGYRVREKLARLPAKSDAVGRTSDVKGEFTSSTQGNDIIVVDMRVEVNMTTLKSDEDRRDNRLKTTGLETDRYPTATFVASGPVTIPYADAKAGRGSASVSGDLTLHGTTKQVTIPLDIQLNERNIEVAGAKVVAMSDYAITPPDVAGIVTVEPFGTLEFKLVFAKT